MSTILYEGEDHGPCLYVESEGDDWDSDYFSEVKGFGHSFPLATAPIRPDDAYSMALLTHLRTAYPEDRTSVRVDKVMMYVSK